MLAYSKKDSMRKNIVTIIIAVIGLSLLAVGYSTLTHKTPTNKLNVVGSFYPLAHFAEQVGGDKVNITTIVPAGVEPHDFEPTPKDIATVQSAQLFLINGSGLDPWAEKAAASLRNTKTITMSNKMPLLPANDTEAESPTDPHFWLDPKLAQQEVTIIRDTLITVDPTNQSFYEQRAKNYLQDLATLDQEYRAGLANCSQRQIITTHAAFSYLAKEYNIEVVSITGLSPDEEPSAKKLAELTELIRQKNIHYILFETLVSHQLADTLARETGAQTLVFNPLEGLTNEEITQGATYLSVMRENLATLKTAMQCQ
jgi:zinc transport system substrate-binding protein